MLEWYLITHNNHAFQLVTSRLHGLGVEFFAPTKRKVTRRADCSGVRITEKQLFPGYVFIRLDPELVHTSVISEVPGVKEFVRFGGEICRISDLLIESLKQALLLRFNKNVTQLEYRNVSPEVVASIESIATIKCQLARQTAFFELLQNNVSKAKNMQNSYSRVVSVTEYPYVNELIK